VVDCGDTITLRLCTSNAAGLAPFTFKLGEVTFGPTNDTCHDFTVGPITAATTTFTGTVTDASGCAKSASVTLTTTAITPQIEVADDTECNGVLTISTTVPGSTGCEFAYTIDGQPAANTETDTKIVRVNTDGTLSYRNLDNTCHKIGVTATCGSCSGTASVAVKQACVQTTTTLDC
jgi:hypothetical protein